MKITMRGFLSTARRMFVGLICGPFWLRSVLFLLTIFLIAYGSEGARFLRNISEPVIDLVLSIGIGLLTAFLALLAGHVATEKRLYRWLFWVGGIMLAAFFVITGVRTYRTTLISKTPEQIVMAAVGEANGHTDKAIDAANMHTDSEVGMVRNDLNDVRSGLESLSNQFNQGNADLKESISKVGKPDPPTPANLTFTLWSEDAFPVLMSSLKPDKDGIFTVDFSVENTSITSARAIDMWIDICLDCTFASEPNGFDRPSGMREQTRHMAIQTLNHRASLPKETIAIKLKRPLASFQVAMRYSCEVCRADTEQMGQGQVVTINVLPALP